MKPYDQTPLRARGVRYENATKCFTALLLVLVMTVTSCEPYRNPEKLRWSESDRARISVAKSVWARVGHVQSGFADSSVEPVEKDKKGTNWNGTHSPFRLRWVQNRWVLVELRVPPLDAEQKKNSRLANRHICLFADGSMEFLRRNEAEKAGYLDPSD